MRAKILGLMTIVVLGMSSTAFTANRTYYLDVPYIDGFIAFGNITTDGASALTNADLVNYSITLYSNATKMSYTLNPGNSTFSWGNMTATLAGIFAPDMSIDLDNPGLPISNVLVESNLQCSPSSGGTLACYGFGIVQNPFVIAVGYDVVGFNGSPIPLFASPPVPAPWAVASLAVVGPDILWTGLHFYATLVAGPVRVGPGVPNLLSMIDAAQRFYNANDEAGTCHSLDAVVYETRQANGDSNDQGNGNDSASDSVVAYARALESAIACSSGGENSQN